MDPSSSFCMPLMQSLLRIFDVQFLVELGMADPQSVNEEASFYQVG